MEEQEILFTKDCNDVYAVDKALENGHLDMFIYLLRKMNYVRDDDEFACRIHRYFKEGITTPQE